MNQQQVTKRESSSFEELIQEEDTNKEQQPFEIQDKPQETKHPNLKMSVNK